MQQEFYNFITRFNQQALDATKQLIDINRRTSEKMVQNQLNVVDLYFESNAKLMELAKDYQDLPSYVAAQNTIAREYADKSMTVAKESLSTLSEARDELSEWAEQSSSRVVEMVEPIKKAA